MKQFYLLDYPNFYRKHGTIVSTNSSRIDGWVEAFKYEGFTTAQLRTPGLHPLHSALAPHSAWTLSDEEFTLFVLRFS